MRQWPVLVFWMLLASCAAPPTAPDGGTLPVKSQPEIPLATVEQMVDRLNSVAPMPLPAGYAWAAAIDDGHGQARPGTLKYGAPLLVRSPVNLSSVPSDDGSERSRIERQRRSRDVGDIFIIPAELSDHRVVGFFTVPRLALDVPTPVNSLGSFYPAPARAPLSASEAVAILRERLGAVDSVVECAISLSSGPSPLAKHDPHWLVHATVNGTSGTYLVAMGFPSQNPLAPSAQRGQIGRVEHPLNSVTYAEHQRQREGVISFLKAQGAGSLRAAPLSAQSVPPSLFAVRGEFSIEVLP